MWLVNCRRDLESLLMFTTSGKFPVNKIADGQPKDPNLVVKCALTCSHEQADNEHSLTVSKRLVTTERAAFSHELIHDRKND